MADITIDVESKELIANIEEMISAGLREKLSKGLENAGLVVEGAAKRLCPVGDGQLRQSITSQVDAEALECVIGSSVEYAPYVEIGTGIHSSKGDGRKTPWKYQDKHGQWHTTQGMNPHPYLQPAAEQNKGNILKCFEGLI